MASNHGGTLHLQIPKKSHFLLIGRGGSTVKKLQDDFNVKVKIPARDEETNEVVIYGNANDIQRCKKEIEHILGFPVGTNALVTMKIDVRRQLHGVLIGKQGSTLRHLEQSSGCNIEIPDRNSDSSHVELLGSQEAVMKAKQEIEKLLKETVRVISSTEGAVSSTKPKMDLTSTSIARTLFFPDVSLRNMNTFLEYLASATKSLDICVFTITDDRISGIVEDAHRSGVKVRVITDDDTSLQLGSDIAKFKQMGIPVKMDMTPHHMHHKFAILDGVCLMNGSFNWTRSASTDNQENVMITNHPGFVNEFVEHFEKMWNDHENFK